jgi:hypothetical protein
LRFHLAIAQASAALDDAIGQRAFAVVDVGNDGEITDVVQSGASQVKKRRVEWVTRLPTKRFGNCLLEGHCIEIAPFKTRINTGFAAVAAFQQHFSSTSYPHAVDHFG